MKHRIVTDGFSYRIQSWQWLWPFWIYRGYNGFGRHIEYRSESSAQAVIDRWVREAKELEDERNKKWKVVN